MAQTFPVEQLVGYVDNNVTLRDIAQVAGERRVIRNEDAQKVVDECNALGKQRAIIRNLGRLIMAAPDAPHNSHRGRPEAKYITDYVYVGARVNTSLQMRAIEVFAEATNPYQTRIPSCVIDLRGFLVFHLRRPPEVASDAFWVCKPFEGDIALYGDMYSSLAMFNVQIPT